MFVAVHIWQGKWQQHSNEYDYDLIVVIALVGSSLLVLVELWVFPSAV